MKISVNVKAKVPKPNVGFKKPTFGIKTMKVKGVVQPLRFNR